ASDIAIMYFATKDNLEEMYLGGTCEFIDHVYENKNFLGTGYFADFKIDKFQAYKNKNVHSIFSKNTRGLKVIIPFLKEEFLDNKEIVNSVCDSFFISILNKALEVNISNEKIDNENLENIIFNEKYYEQNLKEFNRNSNLSPLYLKTFLNGEKEKLEVLDKNGKVYVFDMYLNMVEGLKVAKYCVFRTNGMKIAEKSIKGYSSSAFNVVLISKSRNEDIFLKSLENEAHTQLSSEHIKNKIFKQNAVRFLNSLDNEIGKVISKKLEKLNPTDGKIDTSDIIYEMNYNFKKIEKESKSTIKISEKDEKINNKSTKGEKIEELTLTKTSTGDFDIDPNGKIMLKTVSPRIKGGLNQPIGKSFNYEYQKVTEKNPSKRTITKNINGKEKKFIKLASGSVRRKIIKNQEKLLLDLTGISEIKKIFNCSLKISAVDGEGKETDDFIITDNYKRIKDNTKELNLYFSKKEIENVSIVENKINLVLDLTLDYNKNLKFIYEVII
ncbi:MAG: hypothetical protein ACRCYT_07335, partial [Cetobacterium sp.]